MCIKLERRSYILMGTKLTSICNGGADWLKMASKGGIKIQKCIKWFFKQSSRRFLVGCEGEQNLNHGFRWVRQMVVVGM